MLSKKYYNQIAEIIKTNRQAEIDTFTENPNSHLPDVLQVLENVADDFASLFMDDNPNFDRDRFLKACGIEQ